MRGRTKRNTQVHYPAWRDLAERCRRLTRAIHEIVLPSHRLGIVQIRPFRMPRGWHIPPHEHSYYEANIILQGRARLEGRRGQELRPGHVFFHAPKAAHSWGAPCENCLRLIVEFNCEPPLPVTDPAAWPCWPDLVRDVDFLLELARVPTPGWIDQAAARLAVILTRILTLGKLPMPVDTDQGAEERLVETVDAFLCDNLHRPVKLGLIAAMAAVSVSSLTHRYRKLAGISAGQRLMTLRMERAAELLKTTNLPLKDVAMQVGIPEVSYFCRMFKRYFSDTPSQLRQRAVGKR
jgi:AraC-like DNA-binding protein/quercetin dioxygenase-like cupin family protein